MFRKSIVSLLFIAAFLTTTANAAIHESTLSCPVIRPIAQGFLANHFATKKLDADHETKTIDQFVKRLDPSKIYLLESDVTEIKNAMKGIFSKLGEDCSGIEKAQTIMVKRIGVALELAKKTLTADFKFQDNIELMIDPNLRQFPKTQKEADDQMLKFIQFQIANYLATDMKLPQAKQQLIHRYELNLKRQSELSKDDLYSLFLQAFATSLDAHSDYLSKDTLEDFEIQMRLSLQGIGAALIWEDGYTTVDNLIPGGSAERSGDVQPKDKIIAVAQGDKAAFENVIDMPLRDVVKLIRGKKGTTVRLTLLRQEAGQTKHVIVSLVRDKINLKDDEAKLVYTNYKEGNRTLKVAIIDLPSFYGDFSTRERSCYEDVKKLVLKATKEKADAMILDLSKNGGGLLTEAVRIAGLFIASGNVVGTQDAKSRFEPLADDDEKVQYTGPLVVLTSRLSASASEIVSGALQDYHRALIVGGDHTFGKGTVQAMINLPTDLGAIKVTTGMFFVPGGASTQQKGVVADIALPSPFSTKDIGEGSMDYSLPFRSVPQFLSQSANRTDASQHWTPVTSDLVSKLKTASQARVEKDSEFQKIIQDLADQEKRKGVVKLAESLKKQKEENKDEKKKKSRLTRRGRRGTDEDYLKTPQVKEAVSIIGDWLQIDRKPTQASR